jgi:cytochrome P450
LILAGFETTVNLLGNGARLLLADSDLAARLRADHEAIPAAVEEFLRFESPVSGLWRVAAEDVELAGETIREGEVVMISLLSANRDENAFEDSHALKADRISREHVAFGYGIHYCIGAPLARMQAQIAFEQMLDRFPKMRRADPAADLRWRPGLVMRGLAELPVVLDG